MSNTDIDRLTLLLTPHGHLLLEPNVDAPALSPPIQQRLSDAFDLGSGHGLLQLGAAEVGSVLPPAWAWWRDFATRCVTAVCATPDGAVVAVPMPNCSMILSRFR